jgi:hypothetical protein
MESAPSFPLSRRRGEDGSPEIYGWVRGRTRERGWLSAELASAVDMLFWVDPGDGPEAGLRPSRWTPAGLPRIRNLRGIEA